MLILIELLVARLLLIWRLIWAVMRLPTPAIRKAADISRVELESRLLDGLFSTPRTPCALLTRQSHRNSSQAITGTSRVRAVAGSGGSGEDTPVSGDDYPPMTSDDARASGDDAVFGQRQRMHSAPEEQETTTRVRQTGPAPPREASILAVDIGGTRTKFLLVDGSECTRLPPAPTARIWQNEQLDGPDKFEPASAPRRMRTYLRECGVNMERIGRLAFSVPGTVDLAERTTSSVVKNTPSMSPKFRGFDFKEAFRDLCPTAKVGAVADNLAAALGVACQHPQLRSALVVVLGTAPAVATVFRDPSGKGKYIETAIWQSWVWFTKVKLDDPHGYCGGLKVTRNGVTLKPATVAKIPHHQARIRFALDDATWQRLRGCCEGLPTELQAHLSEEEATKVWCRRLQAAVDSLAERFHSIYGPPQEVHVLGGNACRCHGRVSAARYVVPDTTYTEGRQLMKEVPVVIPRDDAAQQLLHMSGLVYSSCFKLKQVTAPGQDPLARGWTRGGEIYLWVAKGVKTEQEIAWPIISTVRAAAAGDGARDSGRRDLIESEGDVFSD